MLPRLAARTRIFSRFSQFALFIIAGVGAFLLRFEFIIPAPYLRNLFFAVATWAVVKSLVFHFYGLHRGWWRFVSTPDLTRIAAANIAGSLIGGLIIRLFGPPGFPRSLYFLDFLLCLVATSGIRVAVRVLNEMTSRSGVKPTQRTLIYGGGAAGVMLLRESRSNPSLNLSIVGFIDDDLTKSHIRIQGVPVLGPGANLASLAAKYDIQLVLIALPSATGPEMMQILRLCQEAGVQFRTVPSMAQIVEGSSLATQIRDVAVEDLLGRKPVHLEEGQIKGKPRRQGRTGHRCGRVHRLRTLPTDRTLSPGRDRGIRNRRVIPVRNRPRDASESFPQVPFYPEIGSIQNRTRLDEVFRQYSPSVVYHAAAYKHVPLMEAHVFEAIENNVFGTYNVATAAAEHEVEDFVMISSDKAVRPTNIMGTTKRIAELILLAFQGERTKYVAVRFGNVLGSNGSVIPIFKKQIAAGGPGDRDTPGHAALLHDHSRGVPSWCSKPLWSRKAARFASSTWASR
jgi:FlaA1/EpsC-like NDP-sugar epimerase